MRGRDSLRIVLVLAVLVALWEAGRAVLDVSPMVMPGVLDVLEALGRSAFTGALPQQLAFSFSLIGLGTVVAVLLAALASFAGAASRFVSQLLDTVSSIFHPLPGIALLPVVILWFGTGRAAIIVIIVHSIFWPLLTNIQAGYRSIPSTYRLVGKNLGMSPVVFAARVAVPATLPYIIAGLRIAWARSWRALISAEMIFGAVAAGGGIGWYLHSRRVFMDTAGLFAGILVVMIIGFLVERVIFGALERGTVMRWGMHG